MLLVQMFIELFKVLILRYKACFR